jgi:ABC-2 type transport system ATP-binding protein
MAVVSAKQLRKEYGNLVAVEGVDLEIEAGQVVGLIGPNGAGKTTLLKMLATLLPPSAGELRIHGFDARSDYESVRKHLGYMPDFFNLYDGLSLDECVRFFGRSYGVPEAQLEARAGQALEYVGLTEKRFEPIHHLSRGMTQRLGVANLLVHEPALLLLDEPASGLDPGARIQLRSVLKRLAKDGKTIVISSHILTELEDLCTHLCAMERGRVVAQGSIEAIRRELSSTSVRVRVLGDVSVAAEVARQVPNVGSVTVEGDALLITIPGDPAQHAALNAALVRAGVSVCALSEEKKGLEALFLQISERAEALQGGAA